MAKWEWYVLGNGGREIKLLFTTAAALKLANEAEVTSRGLEGKNQVDYVCGDAVCQAKLEVKFSGCQVWSLDVSAERCRAAWQH